ncbi:MAG TPA: hypothetical protein VFA11_11785 [Acidimicrobiales bacterium]|nr:hypothetical protein [Acidimicrobiales bacterium]
MPNGLARRIECPNCASEILTFSEDLNEDELLERHRASGRCPGWIAGQAAQPAAF